MVTPILSAFSRYRRGNSPVVCSVRNAATRSTRPDRAVVLVTGGTGFLGRHVVAELRAQSMRTRVLMRSDLNLALPCDERAVGELGDDDAIARQSDGGARSFTAPVAWGAGRREYFRDNVAAPSVCCRAGRPASSASCT